MILIIVEKSSLAKKYSAAMGLVNQGGVYSGTFDGKDVTLLNASGHLLTLKYPEEIDPELTWKTLDRFKKIPNQFELRVLPPPKSGKGVNPERLYNNIAKQLARRDLECVWLATDPDDEGELLGWEILWHANYQGQVERVWLSRGEDKASILKALRDRLPAEKTKSIAHAAEARRRADWMFMYLVRTYTYFGDYQALGPNLGTGRGKSAVISVGRVQTPTLAMVVNRDLEIESFIARDHFTISSEFLSDKGDSIPGKLSLTYQPAVREAQPTGIEWIPQGKADEGKPDKPLFVDTNMVDSFIQRLKENRSAFSVESYKEGESVSNPPKTYSLTDAQSDIGKKLKISGSLVQHIISDLYEQEMVSYPRTQDSELPASLYNEAEIDGMLKAIQHHGDLKEACDMIRSIHVNKDHPEYQPFMPKVFTEKKLPHSGLIPTHKTVSSSKLNALIPMKKDNTGRIPHSSEQMRDVYMMIARRFVHTMLPPARLATQTGTVSAPVEDMLQNPKTVFAISGKRIVDPGHLKFFGDENKQSSFNRLTVGETITLNDISKKSETTKPPSRYDEAGLPKAMETIARNIADPKYKKIMANSSGIGTSATRSAIIETLISREYMEIKKGLYHSTQKGKDLIALIPVKFVAAETTAIWEEFLSRIKTVPENEAIDKREVFVSKQRDRLESLISTIITDFTPKMGAKRPSAGGKVTENMKKAIDIIAKRKGETVPRGAKTDPQKARVYLDENKQILENLKNDPPTESQLKMLERIVSGLPEGTEVPDDARKLKRACSKFIDDHKSSLKPSQKQVDMAKSLADKLPEKDRPSADVYESMEKCSKFISAQLSAKSKGAKKKA